MRPYIAARVAVSQRADGPDPDGISIPASEFQDEPAPRLRSDTLGTLRRFAWPIFVTGAVCGLLALLAVYPMAPVYRSTAAVLIEANKAKTVAIDEVYSGPAVGRENFQTQAEMLRSREVALRVIKALSLDRLAEFSPVVRPGALARWLDRAGIARLPSDPVLIEAEVIRRFSQQLSVEPVLLSNIIRVSFESDDPVLAAKVANATVDAFIQTDLDNRYQLTQAATRWINERANDLRSKLDASERALQAYRESEGLLDSRSTVLSGTGKQFDELMQRLVDARVRRSETEEAYNQVKAGESQGYASTPAVVRNPLVQRAKEVEADAERRVAEASGRYGSEHPAYAAMQNELNAARSNVERQTLAVVASVRKEFLAARATEKTLEGALNESKGAIQSLNRKEIQVGQLEREVATNRQLYQTFLSRYKETNATSDLQLANARLVDVAAPAMKPAKPAKAALVGGALLAGMLAAALLVLLRDRMNNTIRRIAEVQEKLHQPMLAALPTVEVTPRRAARRHLIEDPDSNFSESIRTATTAVQMSALAGPRKVLAVTSSATREGKSTFALNFCLAQAQTRSVVLVEGDLRRPTLARTLRVAAGKPGLSELLAGTCETERVLRRMKGSTLRYIVAGVVPSNPLGLLASERFSDLIDELQSRFDIVVIDCPPVEPVSDALVIARKANGVVYVVRADYTPVPLANAGLKRISDAGIPLLGVVLNHHDFEQAERYYGEYSGFGRYGYGMPLRASANGGGVPA